MAPLGRILSYFGECMFQVHLVLPTFAIVCSFVELVTKNTNSRCVCTLLAVSPKYQYTK